MFRKLQESISPYLKSKEIVKKLFFSLVILLVFRTLAAVPVVGIPADALSNLFAGSGFGDLLSTLSGGVLETASVVAIGLSPYINASITLQLLGSVIPALEELKKEGTQGRRKISMYTRYLAVPLAILQSFVIYSTLRGFGLMGDLGILELIAMSSTLSAGAILVMWLGELVSEDGVGGGTSYIIFIGIVAGIPGAITNNFQTMDPTQKAVFILLHLAMVAAVVYVTEAERRVKVQYSRRVRSTGAAQDSFIPIKLTQSGVMPVIFAISMLSFPQLIAQFLVSRDISNAVTNNSQWIIDTLANSYVQNIATFVLIMLFSFFYVTVVFNTEEYAENLQKQGAFIPGIRPGDNTADHLKKISFRLTAIGALFLAFLSILPNLFLEAGIIQSTVVSGTGLLILVNVVLDIKRQLESMIVVRDYGKYI